MSRRKSRHQLRTGDVGWLTSYADLVTNLLIFFVLLVSASQVQTGRMERLLSRIGGTPQGSLVEAQKTLEHEIQAQNLQGQVSVKMTDEGLELSFNSGATFASGQADIRPEMLTPLTKILTPLTELSGRYHYAVEGHTDPVPLGSHALYKSNWELASARSMEVRERLETMGVPRDRIRVESYADTRPLSADEVRGLSKEESLARHRRVVVRLY